MNGLVYRVSRGCASLWFRLWNRLRAEGAEHVPAEGGVLLVANHASYLDPPALGCRLRRPVHYLARSTLGKFPPARWLLAALGVIFVDRDGSPREGLAGAMGALRDGRIVCIFPEGTRTRSGHVEEFKRGALLVLKRAPVAVVPVGVEGTFAALRRGRILPRPARITIRYGQPMSAAEVMSAAGIEELRRRVRVLAGDRDRDALAPDATSPLSSQSSGSPSSSSPIPAASRASSTREPDPDLRMQCAPRAPAVPVVGMFLLTVPVAPLSL